MTEIFQVRPCRSRTLELVFEVTLFLRMARLEHSSLDQQRRKAVRTTGRARRGAAVALRLLTPA
jgi:hypothetical protein